MQVKSSSTVCLDPGEGPIMEKLRNLLVVGGTGRNVGKTECVCEIIARISRYAAIYALKVSAIYPDEEIYHGCHGVHEDPSLVEETRTMGNKDTIRMLRAGATRVFYLRGDKETIAKGFAAFYCLVPAHAAVICESNSLGDTVTPALAMVVRGVDGEVKPRALPLLARADLVVVSDGKTLCSELEMIEFDPSIGWGIKECLAAK